MHRSYEVSRNDLLSPFVSNWTNPKNAFHQVNGQTKMTQSAQILHTQVRRRQ
ncbi:MAG: YpzG family protein [Bacilli bacterium]